MTLPMSAVAPKPPSVLPFWGLEGNEASPTDVLGTTNNEDLRIITNGVQRMVITSDGNVGIGTISPGAKLDVEVDSGGAATIGHTSNSATGDWAIALGYGTDASGTYSTAIGKGTIASSVSSTAMGYGSIASGPASTAMGIITTASRDGSTAMGYGTTAYGFYSTAMGRYTNASGSSSTAMGKWSIAFGDHSTAMGYKTNASGDHSTAMGYETNASGIASTAMGSRIMVDGDYSFGIGLGYRDPRWTITQDHTMAIMGGVVGIGTVSPTEKLHVDGNVRISGALYDSNNEAGTNGQVLQTTGTGIDWVDPSTLSDGDWTVSGNDMYSTVSGDVGIGTVSPGAKLDVHVISGGAATIGSSSNSATGNYAIALGQSTTASGKASTALGAGTTASGDWSTAIGIGTDAYGLDSTAMGFGTNASGYVSTAMGFLTDAYGDHSTAMGYYTNASGYGSTAMGGLTNASGDFSFATGLETKANGHSSTSMGSWITTDGWWSFGIGLDNTPRTITQYHTMAIMGGYVGIGTVSPTSPLHVVGLPIYANNDAALTGGLTPGAFYRTGGDPDLVAVVH